MSHMRAYKGMLFFDSNPVLLIVHALVRGL
jgi:hypothetical protein